MPLTMMKIEAIIPDKRCAEQIMLIASFTMPLHGALAAGGYIHDQVVVVNEA